MSTRVARSRGLLAWFGVASLAMSSTATAQEPSQPAAPAPLARYFPRKDLVVYVEFDGLDAHRDAWTKSAAYRLLTETTTGAMLEQSAAQVLDLVLSGPVADPGEGPGADRDGEAVAAFGIRAGDQPVGRRGLSAMSRAGHPGRRDGAPRAAFDRVSESRRGGRSVRQNGRETGRTKGPGAGRVRAGVPWRGGPRGMTWS